MSEETVKMSKLKVKVSGETHEWTIDDAKKLYAALGELFGKSEVRVEKEYIYWPENRPYAYRTPWRDNIWYCSSNAGQMGTFSLSAEVK